MKMIRTHDGNYLNTYYIVRYYVRDYGEEDIEIMAETADGEKESLAGIFKSEEAAQEYLEYLMEQVVLMADDDIFKIDVDKWNKTEKESDEVID